MPTRTNPREARILLRTEPNSRLEDFRERRTNVESMGPSFTVTDFARAVRYRAIGIRERQGSFVTLLHERLIEITLA